MNITAHRNDDPPDCDEAISPLRDRLWSVLEDLGCDEGVMVEMDKEIQQLEWATECPRCLAVAEAAVSAELEQQP